jgi:SAM-dependent methyltransferase
MVTASLPEATRPGARCIAIVAGDRESPSQQVTILPVGEDVHDYWHRRVGDTLVETGEIDNPWVRPHQRRYAVTFAELDRLDGERHAALEIGVTRLFPFLLTADLGYRRIYGTHFVPDRPGRKRERIAISAFGRRVTALAFNINLEHDPIPLPDASLDLVLCCEVIEHMDVDPMFLLAEVNRIVKPGGRLFITTPNIASARAVWKILNGHAPHFFAQYMKDRSPYRHNYEHDIHSIQALIHSAGFETRMLKTIDVFEAPEPRGLLALERLGMTTAFRGDDIFLLGQKIGPVIDRWPSAVYV